MLSDSESDNESVHQLTINEHYAKAFEYKKEREELEKLKFKYGSDAEDDEEDSETDSEEDESEDEDGEELTPAVDAAILRTLARIKRKDPEIYNSDKGIFQEEQKKLASAKKIRAPKDKSKPVTIKQALLESNLKGSTSRSPSPAPVLPHVEEQQTLRKETIAAFHDAIEEDEELLVPREKTKDEQEREEEEYRAFLEREVGGDLRDLVTIDPDENNLFAVDVVEPEPEPEQEGSGKKKKRAGKKSSKTKAKEVDDQEFLMNYILNRGWIDRSSKHIPTWGEITSSKPPDKGKGKAVARQAEESEEEDQLPTADPDIDEDEFEDIVDRFESSYNFRFEEPDADTIKTYPRNLPTAVRREDTTRKDARARKKERKEEEMRKKKEEVKRLKALKVKEIRAKLERIGKEGGKKFDDDPALQELDLEADWDPDAHDKQMNALYGEDQDLDDEKPAWDDDIDIGDIPLDGNEAEPSKKSKKKKKKKGKDVDEQDEGGVDIDAMDADIERDPDDERWDGTEEMRKRKAQEYMDEVYKLDFNDMVGDMKTRFSYVPVQPQTFALTPAEMLLATDAELNEYMGIKKYAPYRKDQGRTWDSKRAEKLKELRAKITERTGGYTGPSNGEDRPAKKRKGKKERQKLKEVVTTATEGQEGENAEVEPNPTEEPVVGKRKRKKDADGENEGDPGQVAKRRRRRHNSKRAGEGLD